VKIALPMFVAVISKVWAVRFTDLMSTLSQTTPQTTLPRPLSDHSPYFHLQDPIALRWVRSSCLAVPDSQFGQFDRQLFDKLFVPNMRIKKVEVQVPNL